MICLEIWGLVDFFFAICLGILGVVDLFLVLFWRFGSFDFSSCFVWGFKDLFFTICLRICFFICRDLCGDLGICSRLFCGFDFSAICFAIWGFVRLDLFVFSFDLFGIWRFVHDLFGDSGILGFRFFF